MERYGIHALEPVFRITGRGYTSVRHTGDDTHALLHIKHERGIDIHLAVIYDIAASALKLVGTKDSVTVSMKDSYYAFKTQLTEFTKFAKGEEPAYPFIETVELMLVIIAGIRSRSEGGKEIFLSDLWRELGEGGEL